MIPRFFTVTKTLIGVLACLAGLLGCDFEESNDDGYLPPNRSLGALGGAAPIVRTDFERKGWITIHSPRLRSYEPWVSLSGTPDENRTMLDARTARKRNPNSYLKPSRFLDVNPNTKLADYGRYRMVKIDNPQFFEWSILEGAHIESLSLRPTLLCLTEARLEDGTCAYPHRDSFVAPQDVRKLSSVVGLKGLNLDVNQPVNVEFIDALNSLLETFPTMENLSIPLEIDRCSLRWPRSIRGVVWPNPDTLKIPGRAARLEYRSFTDKNGNQSNRLTHADSGEPVHIHLWHDKNLIAVIGPYENPKRTGFRSSPALLTARGSSIEEILRLNCAPNAPALDRFREAAR